MTLSLVLFEYIWETFLNSFEYFEMTALILKWRHQLLEKTRTTRTPAFWGYPPAASWLPTLLSHVGSQVKTRSNDLEDIDQGQRSSHATHLLMLVIICIKYGKNPSRTIDATERTQFSRSRPNDLENIGQGQRSLYATHPLILVIICDKYGKNPYCRFFFQGQGRKI